MTRLARLRELVSIGPSDYTSYEQSLGESSAALIQLRDVVKTFETAAGTFHALRGVKLEIRKGEFVAIIGKSGSGKSTLLNMIAGIDHPTSGEVDVGGVAIHDLNEGQLAKWRGEMLGIVFQFFQLMPTLTAVENVMLPMDFAGKYRPKEREEIAMSLLKQVDIAEHAMKLPSALSGGEQQRIAIARALANDPQLLLADEPTGNLDSKTADATFELFEELVSKGKTILFVTHDRDLAGRVSRVIEIADGRILSGGVGDSQAPDLGSQLESGPPDAISEDQDRSLPDTSRGEPSGIGSS